MPLPPDDDLTRADDAVTHAGAEPGGDRGVDGPRHFSRGRYRIGSVLGEGGMAIVYEAEDGNLKRQVALKQMRPDLAGDTAARRRFFAEAEILAGLDHAGLVSVHEAGVLASGAPFYAMTKVRGQTLAELIQSDRAAGFQVSMRLIEILQRAAETVGFAHGRGIIHLDLKPQNIMIDGDGAVLVMDWGIARRATDPPAPGVLMGTPSYMSPEMASGGSPTTRSDVFALGVILYEVLTGKKPFTRDSAAATLDAVRTFAPLEPRRRTRQISRELSAICMKALAKDPAARYPTAREMAADLRDYRNFLPISAVTPTLRERAVKWARRHPRFMAAIGTFAAALVIFGSIRGYRVAAERAAVEGFWTQYQVAAADITRLDAALARAEAAASASPNDPALLIARDELRERIRLRSNDARSMAVAMLGLTRGRPDPRSVDALSSRMRHDVMEAQAAGEYVRVKVMAETRLELIDSIAGQLAWPEEDVAFLRRALQEAQAALASRP